MIISRSFALGVFFCLFGLFGYAGSLNPEKGPRLNEKKYPGPCRTVRTQNKRLADITVYTYDTNHQELQRLHFDPNRPPAKGHNNKEYGFPEASGLWQYSTSTYYENGRLHFWERHSTDEGMTERATYRYDGKGRKKKHRQEYFRGGKPAFFTFTEWHYLEEGPLTDRLERVLQFRQDVAWKKPRRERMTRYFYEGEVLVEKVTLVYWIDQPNGKRKWIDQPRFDSKEEYEYRGGVRVRTLQFAAEDGKISKTPETVDEILEYGSHATHEDKRDGLQWSHYQSKSPTGNGKELKLNYESKVEYDSVGNILKNYKRGQSPTGGPWESLTVYDYGCWKKK